MAKAVRTIGRIAGAVAVVATFINPVVAAVAAVVATVANIGAQALAKPPPARGSITRIIIDPNAPTPYAMGEGLVGPVVRHDVAYGPTLKKVPNPYRFMATVFSLGPVESISPRINFGTIPSWYNGFLFTDTQLGATPEADALAPQWAGTPGWSNAHKLSGLAAIGWSFLFDREGERFANGIDPLAAYGRWVKVYDPRKDSTFPGGSGSHRLGNESTYEWSENPALHAGTYAYGRFQNGKRVFGVGLPANGIDWNVVAAWANVCDANNWTIFGRIFEPGDRWANLKDICYAGGAEPVPGGVLTFKYAAPKVALDTITVDDLVTDDEMSVVSMQSYRDRLNTVIPQYISPDHNWELIDAGPVVNSTFLTEDGEEKRDVWPFNFVKNPTQAAQLAAYRLFDSREITPIKVVCKPRLRHYRPGECLHIEHPRLGLDHDVIILSRSIDPVTMKVTFELMTETPEKHDFCLGRTGVAPPSPSITQTSEERDALAAARQRPRALDVEFEDDATVESLKPAEPGATEGAVVPTPGSGASGNVKDEGGNLYDPGELLNASMELTPSGQLQFRPLPGSEAVVRGQITLPDIGAASEVALRRAEDDVDALANALATALDEASRTRETFTDAGFFVDEATGQVRIHAVEQTTERLNTVDIRLDAAEANINLRATTNYVDQAIAEAVLDPSQIADLDAIFVRLTAAELDIDGLEATVTTLATVTELTALTGRVTTAESELDALEGTVATKVDTTTFNALETRVTSAETTLTALGDTAQIVNAVTSIRLIEREVDANAEGALAALVQDDRNQRDQVAAVASARQELRTEITDGLTAEATARLALQVEVANNAASLATESLTRASEDAALASQISALEASTDTSVAALTASIGAEQTARTNADSALAADITALEADLATETSQRTAAITAEQQARVDGDAAEAAARTALAARVTTAEADIDANTAAITAEQTARATADSAIAASVTSLTTTVDSNSATLTTFGESIGGLEARFGVRLDVNGRVTGFVQNNDGTQGNFVLVADNFEIIDPDLGPGGTPLTVFQILNGVISGSALNFDDVIGDNRPENNADVTATAQRSIVPQFPIIEVRQYEAGNVGDRTVSHFAKRGETAIGGGTWSLPSVLLGAGTASINSSTGLVTLSGVAQSGAYTVRYTHTDGGQTELPVNVTFIPQEATVRSISATPSIVTWFQSSTTSRTVAHVAAQGSTTLTGGTWSLVSTSGMTASINSSTGLVTVSNATGNGNYRVRYTHTDTVETELVVNLTYYPASDPGAPTDPNYNEP